MTPEALDPAQITPWSTICVLFLPWLVSPFLRDNLAGSGPRPARTKIWSGLEMLTLSALLGGVVFIYVFLSW